MRFRSRLIAFVCSCWIALSFSFVGAGDARLPKPDSKPADMTKPEAAVARGRPTLFAAQ